MRCFPSAIACVLALLTFGSVPAVAAGAADHPAAGIWGFRAADVAAERAREAVVIAVPQADSLRRHLRILTAAPHVAGTAGDRADAEYVRERLAAYGWSARIEPVPVWINYPAAAPRLELLEPVRQDLAVRETGQMWDKDAYDRDVFPAFHGYGASGDVTGHVVYANYGDPEDFEKLAEMGIDVHGAIVLVRYGRNFRGLKVRNAERAGAAGVVIYSDPADDGYDRADPYPRGQARPADAIQRGSVQFLSQGPGDPTTPGWASTATGKRLKPAAATGIPRIPSLPIAYAEAEKILRALEGPAVPRGWQGGLAFTYHLGPGPARAHLVANQDYAVRPIWNVIATLEGRERPDEWVVCGNHRDSWTFGAVDPNSGTICMLELARALGGLARTGWRPRRTIVLCSWDGEEYGLLGSTEWGEAHAEELSRKAVAYLNVDAAVAGKDFDADGSHALRGLLVEALADVPDPDKGQSLLESWTDRQFATGRAEWARLNRERRWRGEPQRPFGATLGTLGSGSDYTVFEDHLGIPCLNFGFEGLPGTYHSIYDDFTYMDRVVDPGYPHHVALTQLWGRVTLRLAEAEILPLHYSETGKFVTDGLQEIEDRMDDANAVAADTTRLARAERIPPGSVGHGQGAVADTTKLLRADLGALRAAASRLWNAGLAVEDRARWLLEGGGGAAEEARLDAALLAGERQFLGPGLPGRPWFRNELYAPGIDTGYGAVALPRIGQAVLDRDPKALAGGLDPVREALERAAAALEQAR